MNFKNKNGKILNVLLSIISLFVIIFIIIWVVNKNNNRVSYDEVFTSNLNNMHETAKEYFASNLPEETNEEIKLSLGQMIDKNLTSELTYGKTVCSKTDSYISINKVSNDEYKVTSNLVCGSKSDNIIEKIKLTTSVENEDGEKIVDSEDENVELDTKKDETTNKTTVYCSGIKCPVVRIDSDCDIAYEYEYVKRTATCPDGYSYSDSKCVKTTDETLEPTSTKTVTDAKKANGTKKVYTDPTTTSTDGKYSCTSGELSGEYCYEYKDKTTTTSTSCPEGYTQDGDSCYKYADINSSTSTSCPSGYTQDGNSCYKYASLNSSTSTYCPSGYTQSGSSCYKYASLNSSTSYSCPSGYTKSGSKCYYYSYASIGYTKWGNPTKTYTSKTKEYTYTHTLEKKILAGTRTVKGITYYNYSIYKRTSYYYCNSGSVSGKYCYHQINATSSTSYYCPSGYSRSGNTCYVKTNATSSTSYSCPTGYTKSGNTCYIKASTTSSTSYSCPSGYTQSGNKCYIKTNLNSTSNSVCPTGYTDNGTNCYKKTDATYTEGSTTYSCPSGYTKTGTGKNTKCYKTVTTSNGYYCENANAKLFDTKCIVESAKNKCTNGYVFNETDNLCHKTTTDYTNVIYKTVDSLYSSQTSLAGYQRTGRANYKMTCTPIVTK